jgi:signal peptidase II
MTVNETAGRVARAGGHWGVFVGIAAVVVVLDQLTKAWLVANVAQGEVVRVVGDAVRLVYHQNSGALFGLFRDQAILFGLISIGVIGLIVGYHARSGRSLYLSVALGFLLGGAIGNLIDRLRLGYVVDFVDIGIGDLRFYTFNVADSSISTAIVLLVGVALIPGLARLAEGSRDG